MDDMQHAGEDDFPIKTLTGTCDTCGQDFYDHILEDWKGNKFACPVQSPTEVITSYLRGFEDGFARRGDGNDFKNLQNKLDECRSENVRLIREKQLILGAALTPSSKRGVDHDELCPKASITLYDEEYHPECTCSPAITTVKPRQGET